MNVRINIAQSHVYAVWNIEIHQGGLLRLKPIASFLCKRMPIKRRNNERRNSYSAKNGDTEGSMITCHPSRKQSVAGLSLQRYDNVRILLVTRLCSAHAHSKVLFPRKGTEMPVLIFVAMLAWGCILWLSAKMYYFWTHSRHSFENWAQTEWENFLRCQGKQKWTLERTSPKEIYIPCEWLYCLTRCTRRRQPCPAMTGKYAQFPAHSGHSLNNSLQQKLSFCFLSRASLYLRVQFFGCTNEIPQWGLSSNEVQNWRPSHRVFAIGSQNNGRTFTGEIFASAGQALMWWPNATQKAAPSVILDRITSTNLKPVAGISSRGMKACSSFEFTGFVLQANVHSWVLVAMISRAAL